MAIFDFFNSKKVNNDLEKARGVMEGIKTFRNTQIEGETPRETTNQDFFYDYDYFFNTNLKPRATEKRGFAVLREAAKNEKIKICIKRRIDSITKLDFDITYKDKTKKPDDKCKEVKKIFEKPSNDFPTFSNFLSAWIKDLLEIDAIFIKPQYNLLGDFVGFEFVPGDKVSNKIDSEGRTPSYPNVAYQFVSNKSNAVKSYTVKDIMKSVSNPRIDSKYGTSVVEMVLDTIELDFYRQNYIKDYHKEGNMPEAIFTVPNDWKNREIMAYQAIWDRWFSGSNLMSKKHKTKFMPNGMQLLQGKEFKLDSSYDEYLIRVICSAFQIPSSSFTQSNNKATAQQQEESSEDIGTASIKKHITDEINRLLSDYVGYDDLEFNFVQKDEVNNMKSAQIDQLLVSADIMSINEVRDRRGLPPFSKEELEEIYSRKNSNQRPLNEKSIKFNEENENPAEKKPNQNEDR